MAEQIKELDERGRTDKKLSFGLYLVFLVIIIALAIVTSFLSSLFAGITTGVIVSTIVMLLVAIYIWWYNWLLYKRRNEHFERIKKLKNRLCELVKEKLNEETTTLKEVDPVIAKRERYRSKYLFFLWLIFSYLGNLVRVSPIFAVFTVLAVIFGLIVLYYLTVDYHYHEQGEIPFFQKLGELLKKKESPLMLLFPAPYHAEDMGSIFSFPLSPWAYLVFTGPIFSFVIPINTLIPMLYGKINSKKSFKRVSLKLS